LDQKVCIGVGAAFRFYLGEYKMAPPLIKKLGLMGLYWGRKGQSWGAFIWGYLKDNMPFLWHLSKIPFRRLVGKKYYE
jgi:UDP-N-acetyl-D-mannosaminuronic acid transferase (WecB/TagA/CpsF family)